MTGFSSHVIENSLYTLTVWIYLLLAGPDTLSLTFIEGSNMSQQLFRDLFRNYTKEIRPVRDDARAVNVTMQLWFMQILKVVSDSNHFE